MLICRQNSDPNIDEAPSFIDQQRQAAGQHVFTTTAGVHNRPAPPLSHQCPASVDDSLWHSWHSWQLVLLPSTLMAAPSTLSSVCQPEESSMTWRVRDSPSSSEVKYLIIDEMSMVGRKTFGEVDRRLRQAFPNSQRMLLSSLRRLRPASSPLHH